MSNGLKTTFLIHGVVSLLFGVTTVVIPDTWATLANWTPFDPTMTRLYGTGLLAIGLSSLLANRASSWAEIRIIVQMELAFTMIGTLVGLYAALITGAPAFVWLSVALFGGFAATWMIGYRQSVVQ